LAVMEVGEVVAAVEVGNVAVMELVELDGLLSVALWAKTSAEASDKTNIKGRSRGTMGSSGTLSL